MNDYSRFNPLRAAGFGQLALGSACLLAAVCSNWALLFGPICLVGGFHLLRHAQRLTNELLFELAARSAGLVRESQRFSSMKPILIAHRDIRTVDYRASSASAGTVAGIGRFTASSCSLAAPRT